MGRKSKTQRSEKAATVAVKNRLNLLDKFMGEAPTTPDAQPRSPYASLFACLLLALAVFAVFGQTVGFDFVCYDDEVYITKNSRLLNGLSLENVAWAFTSFDCTNWHPVTWLSHIADCQLYGLNPGKHHLTNVCIHAVTTILLYLLLRRMTGRFWSSVLVAFLFAVHPLRAESVAWISERKDLLCGLFFMLTLMAYVGYARNAFSWLRYAAVILLFSLGLMSKPMIVTLPFVLLLLDYWPLGRASFSPQDRIKQSAKRLIVEKIPLFVLSAASCCITVIAQQDTIKENQPFPIWLKLENAVIAYVAYIKNAAYPANLSPLYEFREDRIFLHVFAVAITILISTSFAVWYFRKHFPWLLVGWLWYLGMLIPVIGVVQVGIQSMADRYTYLPQIGLYVASAWSLDEFAKSFPKLKNATATICFILPLLFGVMTYEQTSFWKNSEALWRRVLAVTEKNPFAATTLATYYMQNKRTEDAVELYRQAIALDPNGIKAHFGLGLCYLEMPQLELAKTEFETSIRIDPNLAIAYVSHGICLNLLGKPKEAIRSFEEALRLNPNDSETQNRLGFLLLAEGKATEGIPHFVRAIELSPSFLDAYANYAFACDKAGRSAEAIPAVRKALELALIANKPQAIRWLKSWLAEHDGTAITTPDSLSPAGTTPLP